MQAKSCLQVILAKRITIYKYCLPSVSVVLYKVTLMALLMKWGKQIKKFIPALPSGLCSLAFFRFLRRALTASPAGPH